MTPRPPTLGVWLLCLATLAALAGCLRVPVGVIAPRSHATAHEGVRYEALVREGRGAFLKEPRDLLTVATSAEKYRAAIAIRSDEYSVLWEAARTCIWLGHFGPADAAAACVKEGLAYANTAVMLEPEGEAGLFFHGALAGKLAELDVSYSNDAVSVIEQRMTKLVSAGSTYFYGGPDRVLAVLYMRAPGAPLSVGDYAKARTHMDRALAIESHWIENQLCMAELEYRLGAKDGDAASTARARARLQQYFLDPGVSPAMAMGVAFEFARWQESARALTETYQPRAGE